jgi:protein transport protein HofC
MVAVGTTIVAGVGRQNQQDLLLWALAIAVGRGMPMPSALEAFADLRRGRSRRRLLALARLLNDGAPLPDALALVPGTLPGEATALLAVGWRSGHLPEALRQAAATRGQWRPVRAGVVARLAYLSALLLLMTVIVGFELVFVLPKFEAIFNDFGIPLPTITMTVIQASHVIMKFGWPIFLVMMVFELVFPLTLPLSLGGWLDDFLPWLDRLFPSRHSAAILRALACVAEEEQPLSSAIAALLRHYPGGWIQGRLARVLRELDDGGDCFLALRNQGLIRPADAAVLESARRVGNLTWALRETAAGAERRAILRIETWIVSLSTLVLIGAGVLVLVLTSAFFVPVITLIEALA